MALESNLSPLVLFLRPAVRQAHGQTPGQPVEASYERDDRSLPGSRSKQIPPKSPSAQKLGKLGRQTNRSGRDAGALALSTG